MVRDLILDMTERDLLTEDKSATSLPILHSLWGDVFDEDADNNELICNIIVPEMYWSMIKYVDNELIIKFKSDYVPDTRNFRIRLVALKNGEYSLFENIRGNMGVPVKSWAFGTNIPTYIKASMLSCINIDGDFIVKFIKSEKSEELDMAYIYSSVQTDFHINFSDDQSSQLLTICAPGKSYRYPTTGVGIIKYLNCVVQNSDIFDVMSEQFLADSKPLKEVTFDNETCKVDVVFNPENEEVDEGLLDINELNKEFFNQFTDDFVRRNIVINELAGANFIDMLTSYPKLLEFLIFVDDLTVVSKIADNVTAGRFSGDGTIVPSTEYYVVTASLEANTVVMFDSEKFDDIKDSPTFIINDHDESRLYTELVDQPHWITDTCHRCFVLRRPGVLKYMISQEQYAAGKGLFIVPQISANVKNMLGVVQDKHTGRLLGIVSNNTNISDITLTEVTQYIYATQITD